MSLRIKLFLGIVFFFAIALTFFGYMAYDSAVQSGSAREMTLLEDLATGLSHDFKLEVGMQPEQDVIQTWIREFDSQHLAIFISSANEVLMSDLARTELPSDLKQTIIRNGKSGTTTNGKLLYVWNTTPVSGTPYRLTVLHRVNVREAHSIYKRLALPLIIAALIVLWVAVWSTLYIASLLEKLNAQKDSLRHQALHDALTNLPNRAFMMDRLESTMRDVDGAGSGLALLFIDLNRFKEINDTLGHHFGDLLLVEVSKRLQRVLRKSDLVARLGGDEFAVILGHVTQEQAVAIVEKIIAVIGKPIEIESNKLFVTASIGIAEYPLHATDNNTLVQFADVAMYAAKRTGTGFVVYDSQLDAYSRDRLILSNDLRDAVARGQMCVYYQPKADIASGRIIGVEALLRWKHDTFGWVPPERFIPLAEQTGNMRVLTEFVLSTALSDLQVMNQNGYEITAAVNISAVSLQDPELPVSLNRIMDTRSIHPSRIVLEITETAVMDQSIRTSENLNQLADLGFHISMDDFGTGHSSLVNLRMLPLQEIKVDRSFVINMLHNEGDATIVRTIIDLAHSLGKSVVAEGVENAEIMRALANAGCDVAQGYYLSRPMPFADFLAWLARRQEQGIAGNSCVNSN